MASTIRHRTLKTQKPLILQRLNLFSWIVSDVFESNFGRHDWIRTNDLFRVNLHLTFTFNNLTAHGIPPKHLYSRAKRMSFG